MPTKITATFEVTGWDETPYHEPADGPKLSQATVTKRFTGALEATSSAQLLTCVAGDDNAGYIGSERITGSLDGRVGTFVIQHGGAVGGPEIRQFGWVVPGSGTGDFTGLNGSAHFQHDEHGAIFTLEYEIE